MKKTLLILLVFCLVVTARSMNSKNQSDPPWKLDIDTFEIREDTLFIDVNYDDLILSPFGNYHTMAEFKKNNTWTELFVPYKFRDSFYKFIVYGYCDSLTKICVWEVENEGGKEVITMGKILFTNSSNVIFDHNIHVGMSLIEFLTCIGFTNAIDYNLFSVIKFDSNEGTQYYNFDDKKTLSFIYLDTGSFVECKCRDQ